MRITFHYTRHLAREEHISGITDPADRSSASGQMMSKVVLLLAAAAACDVVGMSTAKRLPVVLVPGVAGSQLDAIHYKSNAELGYPWYCPDLKEYHQVWVNLDELVLSWAHCINLDLRLEFNVSTGKYSSPDGVGVRVAGFGTTESIEYLDRSKPLHKASKYFLDFVNYFVSHGYTRDHDLVAAPYDWRYSPWDMAHFYENVTSLVEGLRKQFNSPVAIITHSNGGPVMHAFLNTKSAEWKAQNVAALFPVGGSWLGAVKTLKAMVSGEDFGSPASAKDILPMERALASMPFMMPLPSNWPADAPAVITVDKPPTTYTADDLVQLVSDLNLTHARQRLEPVFEKQRRAPAPGVRVFCIHGSTLMTPWGYRYRAFDGSPPEEIVKGDGDGTVPLHSLEHCRTWQGQQKENVTVKAFPGMEHVKAIESPIVFDYILEEIAKLSD